MATLAMKWVEGMDRRLRWFYSGEGQLVTRPELSMADYVVNVKHGKLRGATVQSNIGGSYISFKGIPYAAPPVGNLRFADPEPPEPWTGVRDAVAEGSKCAQFDIFSKTVIGDDDCLYLNVATMSLAGSRPVMVWIHGGAFILGDGGYGMYSPDYMMGSDVVYVSINYRLGVLGFLHLDHKVVPGNMGLKDQVAALKWVKENIAQFGGDPNNVTIFGESAGGASVHYLLISPLAKGLFHKAIIQSGVALNPFACALETVDMAHRYVSALGKDTTDPQEIVEYLRTVPVQRLIQVQNDMETRGGSVLTSSINLNIPFGPGVDDKSVEPFMPKPREELAAEGIDVPVIIGYASHEGLLFSTDLQDESFTKLDENFERVVPRQLAAKAPLKVPEMARLIRKFYFGDKRITKDLIYEYIQCFGDVQLVLGIHEVVEIQRKMKSPTYFYRFSYDSPNSNMKKMFSTNLKGASHGDELQYIFYASQFGEYVKIEPGSTDDIMRDRFVRMWTDFAKTGNPTPSIDNLITEKWEPVSNTTKNYLEIDADLSLGVNPNEDMWQTWKRIYAMADD